MNFDWKINLGHVLTILAILAGWLVTQGNNSAKYEANEKIIATHGLAIERQLAVNERILDEVHQLSKVMIRLQTQSEDRQEIRDQARRDK